MKPAAPSPWGKVATKMSSLPQARTLRKVPKMTHDMAQSDVLAFTERNREMLPVGLAMAARFKFGHRWRVVAAV
jgi:hypothetical protein